MLIVPPSIGGNASTRTCPLCNETGNEVYEWKTHKRKVLGYHFEAESMATCCAHCSYVYEISVSEKRFALLIAEWILNQGIMNEISADFIRESLDMHATDFADLLEVNVSWVERAETTPGIGQSILLLLLGSLVDDALLGRFTLRNRLTALRNAHRPERSALIKLK